MKELELVRLIRQWRKWRNNWDELCNQCGECCYPRKVESDLSVTTFYNHPCEFLDTKTNICLVYKDRFKLCDHCQKMTLKTAMFDLSLPNDCAYVQTFRIWPKPNKDKSK